jgi:hypothetical protein
MTHTVCGQVSELCGERDEAKTRFALKVKVSAESVDLARCFIIYKLTWRMHSQCHCSFNFTGAVLRQFLQNKKFPSTSMQRNSLSYSAGNIITSRALILMVKQITDSEKKITFFPSYLNFHESKSRLESSCVFFFSLHHF